MILTPMQIFLMKVVNLSNDATMVLMERRNMISTISIKMMERMYSRMSTPGQMVNVLKNPSRIQNTLRHTKLNKEVCMSAISFLSLEMHSIETKRLSFHCLIVSTLPLLEQILLKSNCMQFLTSKRIYGFLKVR